MDPTFFDRACGCLMGLAIGDALGAPVEGMPPDRIKQQYGEVTGFFDMETAPTPDVPKPQTRFRMRGAYTDDTQMALCLLDSLVEAGGFEPVLVAESFCRLIGEKSDLPPDSRSSSNVRIGSSDLDPVNWPTLTFRIYRRLLPNKQYCVEKGFEQAASVYPASTSRSTKRPCNGIIRWFAAVTATPVVTTEILRETDMGPSAREYPVSSKFVFI